MPENLQINIHGYEHSVNNLQGARRIKNSVEATRASLRPKQTVLVFEHSKMITDEVSRYKKIVGGIGLGKTFEGGYPIFTEFDELASKRSYPKVAVEFEHHSAARMREFRAFHARRAPIAQESELRRKSGDYVGALDAFFESQRIQAEYDDERDSDTALLVKGLVDGIRTSDRVNIELIFGLAHAGLEDKIRALIGSSRSVEINSSLFPVETFLNDFLAAAQKGERPSDELIARVFLISTRLIRRDTLYRQNPKDKLIYEDIMSSMIGEIDTYTAQDLRELVLDL